MIWLLAQMEWKATIPRLSYRTQDKRKPLWLSTASRSPTKSLDSFVAECFEGGKLRHALLLHMDF
ncbi:hypothetical protein QF001_000568 [Paraburkholderia youngii]